MPSHPWSDPVSQARDAIEATSFQGGYGFTWFGDESATIPSRIRNTLSPERLRDLMRLNLQSVLYNCFYVRGVATPWQDTLGPRIGGFIRADLTAALQAANCGRGGFESGWTVAVCGARSLLVRRGGVSVDTRKGEWRAVETGTVGPGSPVEVWCPKGLRHLSPGFYLARGDVALDTAESVPVLRFYWNVHPEGAVQLMRHATKRLNEACVGFRLKALDKSELYERCDTAVLYVTATDLPEVVDTVGALVTVLADYLDTPTPAFTRRLAPGLGFAVDPGERESFGSHRCQLLAEGLLRAHDAGETDVEKRLTTVADTFAEAGLDIQAPHLDASFRQHIELPPLPVRSGVAASRRGTSIDLGDCLSVAEEIGERLIGVAQWDGAFCNWIGWSHGTSGGASATVRADPSGMSFRALGADLYSGSAGVGLFLGELCRQAEVPGAAETAVGALRRSVRAADGLSDEARSGLFLGGIGIALVAARVGVTCADTALIRSAESLLERTRRTDRSAAGFDVMSGAAGSILGLLAFHQVAGGDFPLDWARELGWELLERAVPDENGLQWRSETLGERRMLSGYSHGASGVGHALLELFCATGESAFNDTGVAAFRYENSLYDDAEGNWLDLRGELPNMPVSAKRRVFGATWCHGAPGIALAHLRASELSGRDELRRSANRAVATTRTLVRGWLQRDTSSFCLCHGLAGNADVLLEAARSPDIDAGAAYELALEVAAFGRRLAATPGLGWQYGAADGNVPPLMVGLAGTGYFYLRLAAPDVPGILLIRPESFGSARMQTPGRA